MRCLPIISFLVLIFENVLQLTSNSFALIIDWFLSISFSWKRGMRILEIMMNMSTYSLSHFLLQFSNSRFALLKWNHYKAIINKQSNVNHFEWWWATENLHPIHLHSKSIDSSSYRFPEWEKRYRWDFRRKRMRRIINEKWISYLSDFPLLKIATKKARSKI